MSAVEKLTWHPDLGRRGDSVPRRVQNDTMLAVLRDLLTSRADQNKKVLNLKVYDNTYGSISIVILALSQN